MEDIDEKMAECKEDAPIEKFKESLKDSGMDLKRKYKNFFRLEALA